MLKPVPGQPSDGPPFLPGGSEAWTQSVSAAGREAAIRAAVLGIAAGEAFGRQFDARRGGAARIRSQRIRARKAARQVPRRHHLQTLCALSVAQAMLASGQSPTQFSSALRLRLRGHRLGRLLYMPGETRRHAGNLPRCFRGGLLGSIDRLLPAVTLQAAILQGATAHVSDWLAGLLKADGYRGRQLVSGCRLVARATQAAILAGGERWDAPRAAAWLAEGTRDASVRAAAASMRENLGGHTEPVELVKIWEHDLPEAPGGECHPLAIVAPAVYTFLLYGDRWLEGLHAIAQLGGPASCRCAIFSALSAIAFGTARWPEGVAQQHRWRAAERQWLEELFTRLVQWPHGVYDVVAAQPVPTPAALPLIAHADLAARSWTLRR